MDTTYHSTIPIETISLLDWDILLFYHIRYFPVPNQNLNKKEYIKIDRDKSTFKSHRDFDSEIEMTFKHF